MSYLYKNSGKNSESEDELLLGMFLQGEKVYSFLDKTDSKSYLVCINCKRTYYRGEITEVNNCPNCAMNSLIHIDNRSILTKMIVEVLREKIIFNMLDNFEWEGEPLYDED